MPTFNFYSDPQHGWLKVPRTILSKLNIQDKISSYSYQRNDFVYLEEDCDCDEFFKAVEAKGIVIKTKKFYSNKQSKIRSYESFVK